MKHYIITVKCSYTIGIDAENEEEAKMKAYDEDDIENWLDDQEITEIKEI